MTACVCHGGTCVKCGGRCRNKCPGFPHRQKPNLAKQLAKAALGVLAAVARGKSPIASADVIEKRRAICQTCDQWTGSRCKASGCFTKPKTRLVSESCPIGKWGRG